VKEGWFQVRVGKGKEPLAKLRVLVTSAQVTKRLSTSTMGSRVMPVLPSPTTPSSEKSPTGPEGKPKAVK
jgi:hypothetical protein